MHGFRVQSTSVKPFQDTGGSWRPLISVRFRGFLGGVGLLLRLPASRRAPKIERRTVVADGAVPRVEATRAAVTKSIRGKAWRTRLIWTKTDAGRAEINARALVKDRAQRNLLLVIDGKRNDEKLLADLAGITPADFATLEGLGLIRPVAAPAPPPAQPAPIAPAKRIDVEASGFDYATLRGAIGKMISKELGMRGFSLLMILEESTTVEDLEEVAQRLLKAVADRKGIAAADEVSKALFG